MHFKNIFTACELDGAVLAVVPDLIDISVLESDTGRQWAWRSSSAACDGASVVVIPCASQLRTPKALAVIEPAALGLGVAFEDGRRGRGAPRASLRLC